MRRAQEQHVARVVGNFGTYVAFVCTCGELFMSRANEFKLVGFCPFHERNGNPVRGCLVHETCRVQGENREHAVACLAKACLCQLHDDCRANIELSLTCRKNLP